MSRASCLTSSHTAHPQKGDTKESRMMQIRSPRTILAVSAALALSAAAIAPTAAFAKGPGPGAGSCDGDCINEQPLAQQVRARDGSALQVRARDGSGQSVETRAMAGGARQAQSRGNRGRNTATTATQKRVANRSQANNSSMQRGRPDGAPRGPEACEECQFEMGTLNDEQAATLVFMANEEKLAHDVYTALGELYDLPVFSQIAKAEAQHQAAVDAALVRYEIEDTAYALPAGEFSDSTIAALYAKLIEQGSQSPEEAIAVGIFIEGDDIGALEAAMGALAEDAPDVSNVYSNLLTGSQRHLEAFQRVG